MNIKLKIALGITSGVVVGFGAGFVFGRRAAYNKAIKEIDAWKDEMNDLYADNLARATKTGSYSTIEGAHEAILNSGLGLDQEDSGRHAALVENPEYPEVLNMDIPDDQPGESDVDIHGLIERFKNRPMSELGGVTYPGQSDSEFPDDAPVDTNELPADDAPASTVPGFVTHRDPNAPYVISIDEYMEDDSPYAKVEMTYFEGDGVLVDSNEAIVPNVEAVIGLNNFDKWGQGTTDKEQVYIRNERLEIDVELTRDDNTYTRVVLGVPSQEEIDRSMRKPQRMREADDS